MAMKSQDPIKYTFLIIMGLIVTATLIGLIVKFKTNASSYIDTMFNKNNTADVNVQRNVDNPNTLALNIISCYNQKKIGTCYVVQYKGEDINCDELLDLVKSYNPDVVMKRCTFTIKDESFVIIKYNGQYIELELQ